MRLWPWRGGGVCASTSSFTAAAGTFGAGGGWFKRRVAKAGRRGHSSAVAAILESAARRPATGDGRPALLLAAVDMGKHRGSEPGRAWAWACALARRFELHVVTAPEIVTRCRGEPEAAAWTWHATRAAHPVTMGLRYYRDYARWCAEVPEVVRRVAAEVRPVALHHVTLGSFRVLPRYDRSGVPYSLGPLAGGEVTPRELLRGARLPWGPYVSEWCRPWLNAAAAAMPGLRAVVRGSRLALATSAESERVLRRMGAARTAVVFPDRLPADVRPDWAGDEHGRAEELRRRVRLVWSGRAVWWKAGQVAIELLRRLVAAGVDAELRMFSFGHALPAWRRQIAAAGLGERCRVGGFVERAELLRELGTAHGFVYPTLHDSSCPALLEAYAMGLPSLTVGLGGPAVVATPATGFNGRPRDLDTWLDEAVAVVRGWQAEPARWRAASAAARARAAEFSEGYLNGVADRWVAGEVGVEAGRNREVVG